MSNKEQSSSKERSLIDDIFIRINKYQKNEKNELIFQIQTISSQSKQAIKIIYRTLVELDNLNTYLKKEYGGYIVPVINIKHLVQKNYSLDEIVFKCQEYLEDLRLNHYCGRDNKFYCFIFQQAMLLPHQQKYVKVLSSASIMSKKYLNAIFTRKQLPQQKNAQQLILNYKKLLSTIQQFNSVRQISMRSIKQQRICEEIFISFEQISTTPCLSIQPQEHYIIQAERIIKTAYKYREQSIEAYERWQILIESVRESLSSVYKGQHEDEIRYKTRSAQLKSWTKSLGEQFSNMNNCFEQFITHLCRFICKLKFASTSYVVIAEKAENQQKINEEQDRREQIMGKQLINIEQRIKETNDNNIEAEQLNEEQSENQKTQQKIGINQLIRNNIEKYKNDQI